LPCAAPAAGCCACSGAADALLLVVAAGVDCDGCPDCAGVAEDSVECAGAPGACALAGADVDGCGAPAAALDASAGGGVAPAPGVPDVPDVPDMDAANAVTCVRTSASLLFVVSSSVAGDAEAGVPAPVVPVAPLDSVLGLVVAGPSSSVKILSIAATSVAQVDLPRAAAPVALAWLADFSSAFKWRFSSVTRVFERAGIDAAGTSFKAALAWRMCSCAEPCCPCWPCAPGCCADDGAGEAVAGALCDHPAAGSASSAAAAHAVVHRVVERFIGCSS
jgi:hypothetical protein